MKQAHCGVVFFACRWGERSTEWAGGHPEKPYCSNSSTEEGRASCRPRYDESSTSISRAGNVYPGICLGMCGHVDVHVYDIVYIGGWWLLSLLVALVTVGASLSFLGLGCCLIPISSRFSCCSCYSHSCWDSDAWRWLWYTTWRLVS